MRQIRIGFLALFLLTTTICIIAGCLASRPRDLHTATAIIPGPVPAGETWPIEVPLPPSPLRETSAEATLSTEAQTITFVRTNLPPRPKPSVSLTWDRAAGDVTHYRIYAGWSTDRWVTNWLVAPFITNAQGLVYTNTITLTNLENHPYVFGVAATNIFSKMESSPSLPAFINMNSNGSVWSNAFFWLAPSNRTSIVQASHLMPPTWVTVFTVTPTTTGVYMVTGPQTNQWYFRRLVQ